MPDRSWTLLGSMEVLDARIFRLRHDRYRFEPSGREQDFVVLHTPSWVNVIPITADGQVVFIRQFRHGIRQVVVEVPGGVMDPGESPEAAAARELREETGYTPGRLRLLGRVLTNPAIQDNYCYLFAAENCQPTGETEPDPFEHIEVFHRPLSEVPGMIADGTIAHSMTIAAFALLGIVPR
jgi:ADP-ribose pyrophosphatase